MRSFVSCIFFELITAEWICLFAWRHAIWPSFSTLCSTHWIKKPFVRIENHSKIEINIRNYQFNHLIIVSQVDTRIHFHRIDSEKHTYLLALANMMFRFSLLFSRVFLFLLFLLFAPLPSLAHNHLNTLYLCQRDTWQYLCNWNEANVARERAHTSQIKFNGFSIWRILSKQGVLWDAVFLWSRRFSFHIRVCEKDFR